MKTKTALARALILLNNAYMNDSIQRAAFENPVEVGRMSAHIWNTMIYGA